MMTRSAYLRIFRFAAAGLIILAIVGYAISRSLPYARGPRIEIFTPADGSTISSATMELIGRAERIKALTVNGAAASVDEAGGFKATLVAFPGTNVITVSATDQFGRSIEKRLTVRGAADLPTQQKPSVTTASTTAQ